MPRQEPLTAIAPISSGGVPYRAPEGHPASLGAGRPHGPQHRDQIAGDRELAQRLGQLAGADRPPRGADREDAGDGVDAGVQAGDVGDEDALAGLAQQLREGRASRGRRPGWRPRPRAGSGSRGGRRCRSRRRPRGWPCRCRRGRRRRRPPSIRAVRRRGTPSPSKGAEAEPVRVAAVVVEDEAPRWPAPRRGARRTGSGRAARRWRRGRRRSGRRSWPPRSGRGRPGRSARPAWRRRSSPSRALAASPPIASGSRPSGPAGEAEAEAGLPAALALGQRLQVGEAVGGLELAGEAGRGGDRDPLGGIGVDDLLDPDDSRVGGERGALDRAAPARPTCGGRPGLDRGVAQPRQRLDRGRPRRRRELVLVGDRAPPRRRGRRSRAMPASERSVP